MTEQQEPNTALEYEALAPEMVEPLIHTDLSPEKMDSVMASIVDVQSALNRLPLLRRINLIGLMQNAAPASMQRKIAVKKAVQTAQYLGQHNRACIAFWRQQGIESLDFLDPEDAGSLRKLPMMTAKYFYTYSPEDRFSRDMDDVTWLSSSGSTGKPKLFLTCPEDALRTLPAMKQFLRTNWRIDAFDRVEIVVHTIRAEPDEPQWGAGYNMTRLLTMIADDYPHIHFKHLTEIEDSVATIRDALSTVDERTLIAVYSYPPDASAIVRELTDFGRSFVSRPEVAFKFSLTGEAMPPYRMFQMAAWLRIVDEGFVDRTVGEIVQDSRGRDQLRALVESFSTGFGTAEIQTGVSGNAATILWNVVMYLLERNEPDRVAPFLEKYFDGQSFPWSALKASPNVFFLLGSEDAHGDVTLDPPAPGKHSGPAFATALSGSVVNCLLDYMHIWDMEELAGLLEEETGVDIRQIARQIGVNYGAGDMVLTNGRMDNTGAGGLDAAISWGGQSIYGHNFHVVASQIPGLSGQFTAQSIDYRDGERVFWVHFEANRSQDLLDLQSRIKTEVVEILASINGEFAHRRELLLREGGEERFQRTFQIRVLPYGHPRFEREPGQRKHNYIRKPQYIDEDSTVRADPIATHLIRE